MQMIIFNNFIYLSYCIVYYSCLTYCYKMYKFSNSDEDYSIPFYNLINNKK